jgi:hypothetical protein
MNFYFQIRRQTRSYSDLKEPFDMCMRNRNRISSILATPDSYLIIRFSAVFSDSLNSSLHRIKYLSGYFHLHWRDCRICERRISIALVTVPLSLPLEFRRSLQLCWYNLISRGLISDYKSVPLINQVIIELNNMFIWISIIEITRNRLSICVCRLDSRQLLRQFAPVYCSD